MLLIKRCNACFLSDRVVSLKGEQQITVHLGLVMKYDIRNYVKQTWHDREEKDVYLYITAYCMQ